MFKTYVLWRIMKFIYDFYSLGKKICPKLYVSLAQQFYTEIFIRNWHKIK